MNLLTLLKPTNISDLRRVENELIGIMNSDSEIEEKLIYIE